MMEYVLNKSFDQLFNISSKTSGLDLTLSNGKGEKLNPTKTLPLSEKEIARVELNEIIKDKACSVHCRSKRAFAEVESLMTDSVIVKKDILDNLINLAKRTKTAERKLEETYLAISEGSESILSSLN